MSTMPERMADAEDETPVKSAQTSSTGSVVHASPKHDHTNATNDTLGKGLDSAHSAVDLAADEQELPPNT